MTPCPSPGQLRLLVADRLDQRQRRPVETHVASCPTCQDVVTRLVGSAAEEAIPDRLPPPPADLKAPLPPTALEARSAPEGPGPAAALPTVPGYEVLEELGKGGMGVVYKARQVQLNRVVALKMILSGPAAAPGERKRFATEAEAVARLEHPNIVQIHEIGEWNGQPYFSLEFAEGGSLADHLRGLPLAPGLAARFVETLARAIHVAHRNGIVHRDLKPANILLAREPNCDPGAALAGFVPKITDFGLARKLDVEQGQTQSGAIVGTPSYMSPEQASGHTHRIGPGVDIYALGAILYELLTGRPPFLGESLLDTLQQVRSEDPVPPSRLRLRLPRDLETICLKCLHKEPARRYGSALDLADDLRNFLETRPIRARPIPVWERVWKWGKRRPAAALAVVATLLTVFSLTGGALAYQHQRAQVGERELRESLRLTLIHDRTAELIRTGQQNFAAGNLGDAERDLTSAENLVRDEPSLVSSQEAIRRALGAYRARRAALLAQQRFFHWRDQALFHGVLFTGVELAPNRTITREAAGQALGVVGLAVDRDGPLDCGEGFTADEREAIRAGCCECLLAYAETLAQDEPPRHLRRALAILDRSRHLVDRPTRAFHLRRQRYLALLGKHDEAIADAAEALRRGPESARLFWNTARIYARVAKHLDAAPAGSRSRLLQATYQERAVRLLESALARVPAAEQRAFWKKYVQADAALAPLRATAGYRELDRAYGRPAS